MDWKNPNPQLSRGHTALWVSAALTLVAMAGFELVWLVTDSPRVVVAHAATVTTDAGHTGAGPTAPSPDGGPGDEAAKQAAAIEELPPTF